MVLAKSAIIFYAGRELFGRSVKPESFISVMTTGCFQQ